MRRAAIHLVVCVTALAVGAGCFGYNPVYIPLPAYPHLLAESLRGRQAADDQTSQVPDPSPDEAQLHTVLAGLERDKGWVLVGGSADIARFSFQSKRWSLLHHVPRFTDTGRVRVRHVSYDPRSRRFAICSMDQCYVPRAERKRGSGICLYAPDAETVTLAHVARFAGAPSWSHRDGRFALFTARFVQDPAARCGSRSVSQLCVWAPTTGKAQVLADEYTAPLARAREGLAAVWSSDDRALLFVSRDGRIARLDLATRECRQFAPADRILLSVGERVAYVREGRLYVATLDGLARRDLGPTGRTGGAALSPDGRFLAVNGFGRRGAGRDQRRLWVFDLKTGRRCAYRDDSTPTVCAWFRRSPVTTQPRGPES